MYVYVSLSPLELKNVFFSGPAHGLDATSEGEADVMVLRRHEQVKHGVGRGGGGGERLHEFRDDLAGRFGDAAPRTSAITSVNLGISQRKIIQCPQVIV